LSVSSTPCVTFPSIRSKHSRTAAVFAIDCVINQRSRYQTQLLDLQRIAAVFAKLPEILSKPATDPDS
jgi:hypothetical protein